MRMVRGTLAVVLALAPATAAAQHDMAMGHEMKHELGVDLGVLYSKPKGGDGVFSIGTPVNVRVGFVSGSRLVVEPRFTFNYASGGGDNAYVFTPDINLLFALSADGNRKGPYLTTGAGVDLTHVKVSTALGSVSTSTSQFNFNGGIGTRVPYESGAIRLEAFVRYLLKNTSKNLPNTLDIGARIGLSLWH